MKGFSDRFEVQSLGRETAILDRQTGDLHLLNETAAMVLELLGDGKDVGQIEAALRVSYEVDEEIDLHSDLGAILSRLRSIGILKGDSP